jgi:hypothetical protein
MPTCSACRGVGEMEMYDAEFTGDRWTGPCKRCNGEGVISIGDTDIVSILYLLLIGAILLFLLILFIHGVSYLFSLFKG